MPCVVLGWAEPVSRGRTDRDRWYSGAWVPLRTCSVPMSPARRATSDVSTPAAAATSSTSSPRPPVGSTDAQAERTPMRLSATATFSSEPPTARRQTLAVSPPPGTGADGSNLYVSSASPKHSTSHCPASSGARSAAAAGDGADVFCGTPHGGGGGGSAGGAPADCKRRCHIFSLPASARGLNMVRSCRAARPMGARWLNGVGVKWTWFCS
eukprot:scaffold2231_cov106-Isochrysis_galbana.AAC.7